MRDTTMCHFSMVHTVCLFNPFKTIKSYLRTPQIYTIADDQNNSLCDSINWGRFQDRKNLA